jgi:hypothetical protein
MTPPPEKKALDHRRQIIFLKTFDQKIAGLRRENERLERVIANPKIRFSRSSLGGLYRIVNSLLSAGPMYGLDDIGKWAEKTRDWTVEMGKRTEKPSKDELGWLLEAIAELADLRDRALGEIEEQRAAAPAETGRGEAPMDEEAGATSLAEDQGSDDDTAIPELSDQPAAPLANDGADKADTAPESVGNDAPFQSQPFESEPSADSMNTSFPFREQPSKQSVREVAFDMATGATNTDPERTRDRTSTIPIGLEDLNEVTGPVKPPPLVTAKPVQGVSPAWRVIAILAILAFVGMAGYHVCSMRTRGPSDTTGQVLGPVAKVATLPPQKTATPVVAPLPEPAKPAESPAAAEDPEEKAAPSDATKKPDVEPDKAQPKAKSEKDDVSSGKRSKRQSKKRESDQAEKERDKAPENTGTLVVKAPDGDAAVFVLVDGISRGKAPVKVRLKPGIHEVVFSADGRRAMRMVPIREEKTKTIDAKVP